MTARGLPSKRVAVLFTPVEESLKDVPEKMFDELNLAISAREVLQALASQGHAVRKIRFGSDLPALAVALREFGAEAVFNLSECPMDSAQKEPHGAAFLELLGLPYTGNSPLPLSICNNKALTKHLLSSFGIPTPAFRLYSTPRNGRPGLRFPLIVKPACEDGSAGITEDSVVDDAKELRKKIDQVIGTFRQEALVEEYIGGREFNVAVLGNGTRDDPFRALPPAELVYRNRQWRVCSFESKWDESHPAYLEIAPVCPARIPETLCARLCRLAVRCAEVFQLNGYARVDFRMGPRGKLYVLEVNPNPDISSNAGLARAARAAGLPYEALIGEILRLGLSRGVR